MTQDEPRTFDKTGKRDWIPKAERQEKLTQLVLCSTKLSAREALLLREVFPDIFASYHDQVWNSLRQRGLLGHEVDELLQEAFFVERYAVLPAIRGSFLGGTRSTDAAPRGARSKMSPWPWTWLPGSGPRSRPEPPTRS